MSSDTTSFPYLHGFNQEEQDRLYRQAEFGEQSVYRDVDFSTCKSVIEVGSGVGAQSAILLRRFPKIDLTCVDASEVQIQVAENHLSQLSYAKDRYKILQMDAQSLDLDGGQFDGAFLCWILEHVADPLRVLSEVRRVLRPGGRIYVTEVMNSTFFLDPYCPNMWKYWMAFNDYQYDGAGDPFIGAKMGSLLNSVGFRKVRTKVRTWHFDARQPEKRRQAIAYWKELLLSAAGQLIEQKYTTEEVVDGMKKEMRSVQSNPNAVFLYSFMQATAQVG